VTAGTSCEILAAGIKSSAEALDTVLAGAHHLSLPLGVIKEMARSAWTEQAMDDFDTAPRT
jgi:transaldolase